MPVDELSCDHVLGQDRHEILCSMAWIAAEREVGYIIDDVVSIVIVCR
ncbi:hypothetical protein [Bradyrhizobium sp.]|nr:hypothetical protein [Bradyrhizobium sp.]HWX60200.1 hypothetical protein [Bradyrhizobium sp.]